MSAPELGPTCATCRYFKRVDGIVASGPGSQVGECRARPPLPIVSDRGIGSAWPVLAGSGWCGEHRRPSDSVFPTLDGREGGPT